MFTSASAAMVLLSTESLPTMHDAVSRRVAVRFSDGASCALRSASAVDHRGNAYSFAEEAARGATTPQREHIIDAVLLREGHTYNFTVSAVCDGGISHSGSIAFSTPWIVHEGVGVNPRGQNSQYPKITVEVSNTSAMQPGWTWWSNFPGGNNSFGTSSRLVDETGYTRWYASCTTLFSTWFPKMLEPDARCGVTGVQLHLSNGNVVINWATNYAIVSGTGLSGLIEINTKGVMQHVWVSGIIPPEAAAQEVYIPIGAVRIPVQDINHDVQELPNSHWMLIAYDVRLITTAMCPQWSVDQNVTGDLVIEFNPYDANASAMVVKSWSTFDALDVCATYPGVGAWPSPEWIHMNAFDVHNVFVEKKNELIFSSFSLGAYEYHDMPHNPACSRCPFPSPRYASGWVYAVRYADDADGVAGSLLWVLGRPRPSDTAGPDEAAWFKKQPHYVLTGESTHETRWQAGQHNANIVGAGGNKLLMFDNGAKTGGKSDQGTPSRLFELDITTRPKSAQTNGIASVVFNYTNIGREGPGRSPFLGGARKLANGNYLGQFGALTVPSCNAPCERNTNVTCMYARVVELSPTGEIVFAMSVGGIVEKKCYGWNGYRATRTKAAALEAMQAAARA